MEKCWIVLFLSVKTMISNLQMCALIVLLTELLCFNKVLSDVCYTLSG